MQLCLTLPPLLSQRQLTEIVPNLAFDSCSQVTVDFSNLRFITPVGVVLLVAILSRLQTSGTSVQFVGQSGHPSIFQYLQRIDFFATLGFETDENFNRRDPSRRFLQLQTVGLGNFTNVDELARAAADCIAPELCDEYDPLVTGHLSCLEYCLSELVCNIQQHSRGAGFVMAQYYPAFDSVTIAVADTGIGIARSLQEGGYFLYEEQIRDLDAIRMALQPGVSAAAQLTPWGESVNAGVGLTILMNLALVSHGESCIVSGSGMIHDDQEYALGGNFPGTLVAFRFNRNEIMNYAELLEKAKLSSGLDSAPNLDGITFE